MTQYWIGVASADHVRRGRSEGFMQVNHGKAGPLKRIRPGDGIVYYSPTTVFRGGEPLKAFTAIGIVADREPYAAEMGEGFACTRRDVDWMQAEVAPIRPLLDELDFTRGKPNWGYQLRFGLFSIGAEDFWRIAAAMHAEGRRPDVTA